VPSEAHGYSRAEQPEKEAVAKIEASEQHNLPTFMPQLTPKNPHQAAQQYAATLRSGCTPGAIDLNFLRELAARSPELRRELGVYFGIIERDGSPAVVRLPQLRKQVPVLLVTGTRTKTVLEQVTFVGTQKGFWRIQYASGRRATITPVPTSCWMPTGSSTCSPKRRRP
jgi:hypothetical protein